MHLLLSKLVSFFPFLNLTFSTSDNRSFAWVIWNLKTDQRHVRERKTFWVNGEQNVTGGSSVLKSGINGFQTCTDRGKLRVQRTSCGSLLFRGLKRTASMGCSALAQLPHYQQNNCLATQLFPQHCLVHVLCAEKKV